SKRLSQRRKGRKGRQADFFLLKPAHARCSFSGRRPDAFVNTARMLAATRRRSAKNKTSLPWRTWRLCESLFVRGLGTTAPAGSPNARSYTAPHCIQACPFVSGAVRKVIGAASAIAGHQPWIDTRVPLGMDPH